MRAVFVCLGVWSLAVSSASGQFTILSQNRRVEAHANISYETLPGEFIRLREDPERVAGDDARFAESVTAAVEAILPPGSSQLAGASSIAWQDSALASNQFIAMGGVRDVDRYGNISCCGGQQTSAQSVVAITFSVATPTPIMLSGILVQPPNQTAGFQSDERIFSGMVRYSLIGPNTNIVVDPPEELIETFPMVPVPAVPQRFNDSHVLDAGTYNLTITASLFSSSLVNANFDAYRDVSYDVTLTAIPEPTTWTAAAISILFLFWRRYQF
jgi:hypothetical protein